LIEVNQVAGSLLPVVQALLQAGTI